MVQTKMNIWNVVIDNIVISKLVETKTSYKYLIEYLDKVIRPLILLLPKISDYIKIFKIVKGVDKDKNNRLISFCKDDEKLFKKHETFWAKIEYLRNLELNALPVYNNRYIKNKIRTWR